MKKLVLLISLTSILVYSQVSFAGEFVLRVLSYNVKGLPWPLVKDSGQFKKIGQELAKRRANGTAPHIVTLQEAFIDNTDEILSESGYPYVEKGPGKIKGFTSSKILGSGLVIMSEFPIIETRKESFDSVKCAGWDCFANKGVMLSLIQVPQLPYPVQIGTTHMNAKKTNSASQARFEQIQLLNQFIVNNRWFDNPIVVAGDFNLKPNRPHYSTLVETTGLTDASGFCLKSSEICRVGNQSTTEMLWEDSPDRQMIGDGDLYTIAPIYVEANFRELDLGFSPPSDHDGLEVHYLLRW